MGLVLVVRAGAGVVVMVWVSAVVSSPFTVSFASNSTGVLTRPPLVGKVMVTIIFPVGSSCGSCCEGGMVKGIVNCPWSASKCSGLNMVVDFSTDPA